jgi:hypothetical protein
MRFGSVPKFEIAADERVTVNPQDMKYRTKGISDEDKALLAKILKDAGTAYPDADGVQVCTDGNSIVDPTACNT